MQIQLLILQIERQLVTITAMRDRLKRRWGLGQGQRRQRRYWVRPWLSQAEHEEEDQYTRLMLTLELDDPMAYRNFIRMLEQRLGPEIQRERTWMRDPLSPGLKLVVTLRHLVSGDSYPTLQFAFRVARSTINKLVPKVCDAIIRAYRDEVMTCSTSAEDWLKSSLFSIGGGTPHMPWVPWMESTFPSDVNEGVAASTTTTRAST